MQRPGAIAIADRLADICGTRFARFAGVADEVAGAVARWVAVPGSVHAAAEVLRLAAAHDLAVVPRGAGTKIDWGATPSRVDIMIDTGRLAGIRHEPGSPVAEVGAGTPLRAVQAVLERTGERLALDPPSPGATVGGVVATDEPGPLRHRHGTPGDQLVGVSYLDASGELTRADPGGGGPEAARMLCGSQGSLALLVASTFRVQPIPAGRLWVSRSVWTPLEVHDLVRAVETAPVDPAAIEVDLSANRDRRPPRRSIGATPPAAGTLAILLEGGPAEVVERAADLIRVLGGDAAISHRAPDWWRRYPFRPDDVALRVDVPLTDLHAAVYALRDASGAPVPVRGSAGRGALHATLPGDTPPERVAAILAAVRGVLLARRGRCVVLAAPVAVRQAVDLWGHSPTLSRLRAAKERLDPGQRFAPGRLPA